MRAGIKKIKRNETGTNRRMRLKEKRRYMRVRTPWSDGKTKTGRDITRREEKPNSIYKRKTKTAGKWKIEKTKRKQRKILCNERQKAVEKNMRKTKRKVINNERQDEENKYRGKERIRTWI